MKPQPGTTKVECSLCGEPWDAHPENAKAEDCIKLLKAKVARLERQPKINVTSPWSPAIPARPYVGDPLPLPYRFDVSRLAGSRHSPAPSSYIGSHCRAS